MVQALLSVQLALFDVDVADVAFANGAVVVVVVIVVDAALDARALAHYLVVVVALWVQMGLLATVRAEG